MLSDDHSRVMLKPLPGKLRMSDYINANYIDVSFFLLLFCHMSVVPSAVIH